MPNSCWNAQKIPIFSALADADNVLESTNFLTAIKSCVEELNKAIGGVNGATPGADQFATMLEYCVYKNAPVTLHSQVVTVDNALNSNENIGLGNDEDKWVAATLVSN